MKANPCNFFSNNCDCFTQSLTLKLQMKPKSKGTSFQLSEKTHKLENFTSRILHASKYWYKNTRPGLKKLELSYLFLNLKHLLCLTSVILGLEVSCFLSVSFVIMIFSNAFMNLRKCFMYSGYVSRLQCPPPFTHKGSYFSFDSSHKRFPWDKSTMSSFVPCKMVHINYTSEKLNWE